MQLKMQNRDTSNILRTVILNKRVFSFKLNKRRHFQPFSGVHVWKQSIGRMFIKTYHISIKLKGGISTTSGFTNQNCNAFSKLENEG